MTLAAFLLYGVGFLCGLTAGAFAMRRYRDEEVADLLTALARWATRYEQLRVDTLERVINADEIGWK